MTQKLNQFRPWLNRNFYWLWKHNTYFKLLIYLLSRKASGNITFINLIFVDNIILILIKKYILCSMYINYNNNNFPYFSTFTGISYDSRSKFLYWNKKRNLIENNIFSLSFSLYIVRFILYVKNEERRTGLKKTILTMALKDRETE